MGFNSAFKGLTCLKIVIYPLAFSVMATGNVPAKIGVFFMRTNHKCVLFT